MIEKTTQTYSVSIYISGPIEVIEHACRSYCSRIGLCVTVSPTKFIYTGGEELGCVVGLINYPRFPKSDLELDKTARDLAKMLLRCSFQDSVLIVSSKESIWLSKRSDRESAAPDLLAACKAAMLAIEVSRNMGLSYSEGLLGAHDVLRAAVAKAEVGVQ